MGLLPRASTVSLSQQHLTLRAKERVVQLARHGYKPATPRNDLVVVGDPGIQTFRMMLYNMVEGQQISAYDAHLGAAVATVLCGGEVDAGTRTSEAQLLEIERRVFVELCQQPKTAERIEHMLKKGKPLRN